MNQDVLANAAYITPSLFGNTDIAGGIPHEFRPLPSNGPVYFEGALILALSFQENASKAHNGHTSADTADINRATANRTPNVANEIPISTPQASSITPQASSITPQASNNAPAIACDMHAALQIACDAHTVPQVVNSTNANLFAPYKSTPSQQQMQQQNCMPHTIMQLWDCLHQIWFAPHLTLARYEQFDVVSISQKPVYVGAVHTACNILIVPGWSSECAAINSQFFLRWKPILMGYPSEE